MKLDPIIARIIAQADAARTAHPGMVLLFRNGNWYVAVGREDVDEVFRACNAVQVGSLIDECSSTPTLEFSGSKLDLVLRELLKAGRRVAICEPVIEGVSP